MKRGALAAILAFLISIFAVSGVDYTVTRQFTSPANAGADVVVTLLVDVGPDTDAYAIDEVYPAGWTVKSNGGGSTDQAGHLKWVVIGEQGGGYTCPPTGCESAIQDRTISYTLVASNTAGTYTFSGQYMFDTQTSESAIGGNTQLQVVVPVSLCNDLTTQTACQGNSACAWCPLGTPSCKNSSLVQCTSAGCVNNASYCTNSCGLVNCGSSQTCISGSCQAVQSNTTTPPNNTTNTTPPNNPPADPPACVPSWNCAWGTCEDVGGKGQQSGTCEDTKCNNGTKTETRSCRLTSTTSGSGSTGSSGTATSGRNLPGTGSSTGTSGRNPPPSSTTSGTTTGRTPPASGAAGDTSGAAGTEKDKPSEETVLLGQQSTFDYLFYILAGILVGMLLIIAYYFYNKRVNLVKQQPPGLAPPKAF